LTFPTRFSLAFHAGKINPSATFYLFDPTANHFCPRHVTLHPSCSLLCIPHFPLPKHRSTCATHAATRSLQISHYWSAKTFPLLALKPRPGFRSALQDATLLVPAAVGTTIAKSSSFHSVWSIRLLYQVGEFREARVIFRNKKVNSLRFLPGHNWLVTPHSSTTLSLSTRPLRPASLDIPLHL
jgi:hypothetical protein